MVVIFDMQQRRLLKYFSSSRYHCNAARVHSQYQILIRVISIKYYEPMADRTRLCGRLKASILHPAWCRYRTIFYSTLRYITPRYPHFRGIESLRPRLPPFLAIVSHCYRAIGASSWPSKILRYCKSNNDGYPFRILDA